MVPQKAPPHDIFGSVRERQEGRIFLHENEEWNVYFDLYEAGWMPVVSSGLDNRRISLLLNERDVELTVKKLHDLDKRLDNVSFGLFRDIVAGAASLSMKYG